MIIKFMQIMKIFDHENLELYGMYALKLYAYCERIIIGNILGGTRHLTRLKVTKLLIEYTKDSSVIIV